MFSRSALALLLLTASAVQATENSAASASHKVVSSNIDPFSLMRTQDRINMMIATEFDNGNTTEQWINIDCRTEKVEKLYWDLFNADGALQQRFYGHELSRYAPPQKAETFVTDNIIPVCHGTQKNARWEVVRKNEYNTLLIDTANIRHIKDLLLISVGYGYDELIFDPPYDAPHDLKVENRLWQCGGGKVDKVLAGLDVDASGYVTDSLIGKALRKRESAFETPPELKAELEKICQLGENAPYKGKGPWAQSKNKPISDLLGPQLPALDNNDPSWLVKYPLPEKIQSQVDGIISTWAKPRFTQLRYTENNAYGKTEVTLDVMPNGQVLKLEEYGLYKVQRLMLANVLQLKFAMSLSYSPVVLDELKTDLHFPLVDNQRFQWQMHNKDEPASKRKQGECQVTGKGRAAEINAAFSGAYLQVECVEKSDGQPESRTRDAWLTDLNIFLPLSAEIEGKPATRTVLTNVVLKK